MLIDSHCHLAFNDFSDNLPDVIDRARLNGVTAMLSVCTKVADYPKMLAISEKQCGGIFNTVGIHPSEAGDYADRLDENDIYDWIQNSAKDQKTVAVGEIGLDYSYENVVSALQAELFSVQLRAGTDAGLPLIIHTRNAEEDTIKILKSYNLLGGVIHCFSGSEWLMRQALDLEFYISFSGIVTFKKADNLRELVKKVPIERILLETDSPFLTPEPVRGKLNEPAYLRHIAAVVAELKGVTLEFLALKTSENFFRLFAKATDV
ncbi:MAG: TatD family hydrolase [Holosporales bacterium]|jgi:TatD DNase family protein|nr:TatD family hydrolase [Holosporales bacterium]